MERADVKELYYISHIANIPSILEHGILSHNLSEKLPHDSIAMEEIQDRRKNKTIPGTKKKLHDYANLYFDAHNPMLSRRRSQNDEICILCIDSYVLDLPDIIISDRNAASNWARFYNCVEGLKALDQEKLYSRFWTNARDQYEAWELKSIKCAEVLVPDKVEPKYITGAFVANQTATDAFKELKCGLTVRIKSGIFF